MRRLRPLARVAAILGACATAACAQDFFWNTVSARSASMGGVYLPSSRSAVDSLAANPAGLTALSGRTADLSLDAIFTRGSFTNAANTDSPLRNPIGLVPYGAFGSPLGHSQWAIGVGIVPEITSISSWRYVDAVGVAGAGYGLQSQKSAILASRSLVGVGFAVSKSVSVGVSMGAVYNTNTLDAPYIFQSNPALSGLKTLLRLHTTGIGWNTGVGIIARATDRIQFNAAWKSKSVIDSAGEASGNLRQQFAALGLAAAPEFHYSASVHNVLPQSALAGVSFRVDGRWILAVQGEFVNWSAAFSRLPVSLTRGTNGTVNAILSSTSLFDTVPVLWKNQFSVHGGVERALTENLSVRAGYAHANNPVPRATLSPLTAAIMTDKLSTGFGYRQGRRHLDIAYSIAPLAREHTSASALRGGEYDNSTVRIGAQSLLASTSFQF